MTDGASDDSLSELLAGRRPPGLYRWHSLAGLREVRDSVEAAGWRWGYVGGWTARTRPVFLELVGEALGFPQWYGRNLDALADCLSDLAGPTVVAWDHWARLARAEPEGFAAVLRVLRDRAAQPAAGAPAFAVLLWGEGPPTGAGSLD